MASFKLGSDKNMKQCSALILYAKMNMKPRLTPSCRPLFHRAAHRTSTIDAFTDSVGYGSTFFSDLVFPIYFSLRMCRTKLTYTDHTLIKPSFICCCFLFDASTVYLVLLWSESDAQPAANKTESHHSSTPEEITSATTTTQPTTTTTTQPTVCDCE